MMSKHTPGPWVWRAGYDGDVIDIASYESPGYYNNPVLHGANGDNIVGCDEYWIIGPSSPNETATANARLIAAAPDLLEALKVAQELATSDAIPSPGDPRWTQIAVAIAKAEGR